MSTEAFAQLYEGEGAALSSLGGVWKRLADLAALDDRFAPYLEQRDEVRSRLEDLAFMLRDYAAENGEPAIISGRQEYLENLLNRYI